MANNTINVPSTEENIQKLHDSLSSPELSRNFGGIDDERPYKFSQFQTSPQVIEKENEENKDLTVLNEMNKSEGHLNENVER